MATRLQAACLGLGLALQAAHAADPPVRADRLLLLDAAHIDGRIVSVGERGHILLSDDAGRHWRSAASPTEATLTAIDFIDARNGWAVGHDAVILQTTDGGETWQQQHAAPENESPLLDVLFTSAQHGMAVGAYGQFLETRDGGATWQGRLILDEDRHINALAGGKTAQSLFAVTEAGGVLTSDDRGQTWRALPSPYTGSLFGILQTGDGALLVFGLRGEVHRSDDHGGSWQAVANPLRHSLMGGHAYADGYVVLVGNGGAVLESSDHGRHFRHLPQSDPRALATALRINGRLIGFGEGGVSDLTPRP